MKKFWAIVFSTLLAGYAWGQDFQIYVSDAAGFSSPPWKILRYDSNGENPEVFIDTELAWPQDIVFLEGQGVVLISNLNTGRITRHDSETGVFINDFASGIGGPTRMKIGPDNLLYVLQWTGNGRVLRYQLDGSLVDEFTTVGVSQSIGMDWDGAGNLYVSSYNLDSVRRFDPNGADLGLFVSSNLTGPTNIWFDDGELLVSDYDGAAVKRFDANGNFLGNFITGLSNSEGVAYLPNGNLLIGNGGTGSVKMYTSAGVYIEDLIAPGSGGLQTPNAVVIREDEITAIDPGFNGVWWQGVQRDGEGVQVDVGQAFDGSPVLVAIIYSYDADGNQVFLVSLGAVTGNTAQVDVFVSDGGVWGAAFDPSLVNQEVWGTGTFTAIDCQSLKLDLTPNAEQVAVGFTNYSFDLERLTNPIIPCPYVPAANQ